MSSIAKYSLLAICTCMSTSVLAEEVWVDQQHANVKQNLHSWSNTIDNWLGTPDPNKPASAGLRIMLDSTWNRYDGYSIKPRVRGKIRLPTLKKHLSVVFGDEDLDNHARDRSQMHPNYKAPIQNDKKYDTRQARNDNASLALRWSDGIKALGIDTDVDLGVRSGADIFLRFKASKEWQHDEHFSTRLEQIYRYGINSKHYVRTNLENKFTENESVFVNNHTYLEYTHDRDENVNWGNSLYRQHNFEGVKRLNYGLAVGGDIASKKPHLDYYGPFINWRQPILREWLFMQPEVHYYNSKKLDRPHHFGAFLRMEAIF
ncbi:hypothetical protein BMT54_05250 [Pasteurellaceae bacterium 15-036681]|nr:hypothetical protein BMT54_05250 [Pasteurellaceae bacterium 15-036681]